MCEMFARKSLSKFKIVWVLSIYCFCPNASGKSYGACSDQHDSWSTGSHPKIGVLVHQGECGLMRVLRQKQDMRDEIMRGMQAELA